MEQDYWQTEAGQFIFGAHRYLRAAKVIRYSTEWGSDLQPPTLLLLAHGIELLCKFPLLTLGKTQKSIKREYGHDLSVLWRLKENSELRAATYRHARLAWDEARDSGRWPDDEFNDNPNEMLDKAVDSLAYLHGTGSQYALRYTLHTVAQAPRPAFLIETFSSVADKILLNPQDLELGLLGAFTDPAALR